MMSERGGIKIMDLLLIRKYHPEGTNGKLYCGDEFVCFAIELPWRDNKVQVSCVPEGRYEVVKRYSDWFKWHLMLKDVPGRGLILFHPANDAARELKGCIAPVGALIDPGKGLMSRTACEKLYRIVFRALSKNEQVFITIKS